MDKIHGPAIVFSYRLNPYRSRVIKIKKGESLPTMLDGYTNSTEWVLAGKLYKPKKFALIVDDNGKPILNEKGKKQSRNTTNREKIQSIVNKWAEFISYPNEGEYRTAFNKVHVECANELEKCVDESDLNKFIQSIEECLLNEECETKKEAYKYIYFESKNLLLSLEQ